MLKVTLSIHEVVALRQVLQHRLRHAATPGMFEARLRRILWKLTQRINDREAA